VTPACRTNNVSVSFPPCSCDYRAYWLLGNLYASSDNIRLFLEASRRAGEKPHGIAAGRCVDKVGQDKQRTSRLRYFYVDRTDSRICNRISLTAHTAFWRPVAIDIIIPHPFTYLHTSLPVGVPDLKLGIVGPIYES
jgi:hypothetical protein